MSDAPPQQNDGSSEPLDSVIARAVDLAYKVSSEQVEQGRRAAEQMSRGQIDVGMINGNMSEVVNRVMRFYSDMGALWFEMLESVVRNPAMGEWLHNFMPDSPHQDNSAGLNGAAMNGAARPNGHAVPHTEIVSPDATGARVSVDMHGDCQFGLLAAEPLHTRDHGQQPLSQIDFAEAVEDWPATVRVTIPAGQPPGNYSGMVLNTLTDEPVGTLCVHIPARPATGD